MGKNSDLYRIIGDHNGFQCLNFFLRYKWFRYLLFYRGYRNSKSKLVRGFFRVGYHFCGRNSGIELPLSVELGEGALFLHPFGITINSKAKIGRNLTMLKGATIGNAKRGKYAGSPIIGNNVYIGLNSVIVGAVTIGDDVLIAANTFVNFDVPSHSIVIGSPGVIHQRKNATEGYITNPVEA